MGRDHESASGTRRPTLHIVEPSEIRAVHERHADLFESLSLGGLPRPAVFGIYTATRKGHVTGPGVALASRALDEENLDTTIVLNKLDLKRHLPLVGFRCIVRVAKE